MSQVISIKEVLEERRMKREQWRTCDAAAISVSCDASGMLVFDVTTAEDGSGVLVALDIATAETTLQALLQALNQARAHGGA